MGIIFTFSSIPSAGLPDFEWADQFVKKGGHALGYGLLALAYAHGLGAGGNDKIYLRRRLIIAWGLAALYAVLDEFHQSFTPGRQPSPWDVVIDSCGAALALLGRSKFLTKRY